MVKEAENISGLESHFVQVSSAKAVEISSKNERDIAVRSSTEIAHKEKDIKLVFFSVVAGEMEKRGDRDEIEEGDGEN